MSDPSKSTLPERPPARPSRSIDGKRSASGSKRRGSQDIEARLFVVLLLIIFAVTANAVQRLMQLNQDRQNLTAQIERQSDTLSEAQKVRAQLEAIAGDTATLAEAGNPNAIQLRDFLAQQGVTIRPR